MTRGKVADLMRNLLRDEWDASATFGVTPDISHGWYDDSKDQPQITIQSPSSNAINGGTTGYDAIDPSGGSPHQTVSGTLPVHCWASYRDVSSSGAGSGAQYLDGDTNNDGVIDEIRRIVTANASGPVDPQTNDQPADHLGVVATAVAEEQDPGSRVAHVVVNVRFATRK